HVMGRSRPAGVSPGSRARAGRSARECNDPVTRYGTLDMERWVMLIVAATQYAKEPNVMSHSLVRTRPAARPRRAGIAAATAGAVALTLAVLPGQVAVAAPADGTVRTFDDEALGEPPEDCETV